MVVARSVRAVSQRVVRVRLPLAKRALVEMVVRVRLPLAKRALMDMVVRVRLPLTKLALMDMVVRVRLPLTKRALINMVVRVRLPLETVVKLALSLRPLVLEMAGSSRVTKGAAIRAMLRTVPEACLPGPADRECHAKTMASCQGQRRDLAIIGT